MVCTKSGELSFKNELFLVLQGGTSTLRHLPVHARAERGAGAPLWSLHLQHSPLQGKAVVDLPLFVICTIHVRPN